jgi:hypothetical protein
MMLAMLMNMSGIISIESANPTAMWVRNQHQ